MFGTLPQITDLKVVTTENNSYVIFGIEMVGFEEDLGISEL